MPLRVVFAGAGRKASFEDMTQATADYLAGMVAGIDKVPAWWDRHPPKT